METFYLTLLFLQYHFLINAEDLTAVGAKKSLLRYGFHKTTECRDFEKAFLCIRKCLDLNYDVANSDKDCECTCYKRKDKAKYTPAGRQNQTRYKLGAPTTSKPIWAQESTKSKIETEIVDLDDRERKTTIKTIEKNETKIEGSNSTLVGDKAVLLEKAEKSAEDMHANETNIDNSTQKAENSSDINGEVIENGHGQADQQSGKEAEVIHEGYEENRTVVDGEETRKERGKEDKEADENKEAKEQEQADDQDGKEAEVIHTDNKEKEKAVEKGADNGEEKNQTGEDKKQDKEEEDENKEAQEEDDKGAKDDTVESQKE